MDTGRKEFILIVEDEKKISDIVKAYLEKEGFRIRVAENGTAALKLMKDHSGSHAS
jgi:DNA-binding response OmpR family regulator